MDEIPDLWDEIFSVTAGTEVTAAVVAGADGLISGTTAAEEEAAKLGLTLQNILAEGSDVNEGDEIARFSGTPRQVVLGGEAIIGLMAKPSGIATSARACVKAAGKKMKVVSGAWRKMPPSDREAIRLALKTGGAGDELSGDPLIYLDYNTITMFGGIKQGIEAVSKTAEDRTMAVQLRGSHTSILKEAVEAVECGAGILFVDTGEQLDVMEVAFELERTGLRKKVKVAFGGDITQKDLRKLKGQDINIVDVGKEIADAPFLDMRLEMIG
jgi:nicotinate-nucleotide pyrophosphorylase (carboxylating)